MGLAMAPLGFYFGFISTAMPILLAAHGVSVGEIAKVSSIGFSPSFWAFTLCPILDVRFTKRTYALFFAAIAAICLSASILLTGSLTALTTVVTVGCAATVIFGNALLGWLPDVIEDRHYDQVGAWSNIANLGAAGVFGTLTIALVRTLHAPTAAVLLGLTVLAPTAMLFFIPVHAPKAMSIADTDALPVPAWLTATVHFIRRWIPRWLVAMGHLYLRCERAAHQFLRGLAPQWLVDCANVIRQFFRNLYRVCMRPGCVLGLICFLSPTACFALTNLFSGMGADFNTSEWWVTALNGTGVAVVCSLGCLAGIPFCRRFKRRTVYVCAGFGGALAALALIFTPHTFVYFAAGVLAYNFFQGINYTAFTAFELEIVGPGNPLAATQIALLTAAANLPISYMTLVDGHFHTTRGLSGMLAADAGSSVAVGIILLLVFRRFAGRIDGQPAEPAQAVAAI
jgi:PAT family beta-lactamase induction signal transducer AmpG